MKTTRIRVLRTALAIALVLSMGLMMTGCMGGQKDISKADKEKYTAIVEEACAEYGYEFESQTVLPLGSELIFQLYNDEDDVEIIVNIDEESTYDGINFKFDVTRSIDSADDSAVGMEAYLDVLIKISEHFTDEFDKDEMIAYINDADLWEAGEDDGDVLMQKADKDKMSHTILVEDGTAAEYKDGDPLKENFCFWWDNGARYRDKD